MLSIFKSLLFASCVLSFATAENKGWTDWPHYSTPGDRCSEVTIFLDDGLRGPGGSNWHWSTPGEHTSTSPGRGRAVLTASSDSYCSAPSLYFAKHGMVVASNVRVQCDGGYATFYSAVCVTGKNIATTNAGGRCQSGRGKEEMIATSGNVMVFDAKFAAVPEDLKKKLNE